MTNQIKSLLMVFVLLFIGACAEADKSDGVNASTSEFYLGEGLAIASIDGAVFTSDAVNPLEYNVNSTFSEEQDATALETAIATELENIVKTKLEANTGSEVTIGAYSISGMVSDTSKLTVTIPSTIGTVDGEKTESYVFNVEFGGDVPVWDGTVTEPVAPIATASTVTGGVYEIYSPSELAWIIEMSSYHNFAGDTVVLKRNIDMNSLPITGLINFAGRFQGNRKEIRNLNIDYPTTSNIGFIRTMGSGGQIDNLTITGVIKGNVAVGGFIGKANGIVTIIGVKNYANITGTNSTGGIIGYGELKPTIEISNSTNYGNVAGGIYTGGFIGYSTGNLGISRSSNRGIITGTSGSVGGFVGDMADIVEIDNSSNRGAVTGAGQYVGGLVGYGQDHSIIRMFHSTNRGVITGVKYTGGFIGVMSGNIGIGNSSNHGAINGRDVAGGLIGMVWHYATANIDNSLNIGTITGFHGTGGLMGYQSSGTTKIDNSLNTGAIKGNIKTAGIVGVVAPASSMYIDNSSNSGAINATGDDTGGLIGLIQGQASIYSSFNSGGIKGTRNVGGIVGHSIEGQKLKLKNVHSYAMSITGTTHYTGGFIGFYYGALIIEDSYWLHDARRGVGTAKASGNIVPRGTYSKLSVGGYKKAANFKNWDFKNSTGAWKLTNKKFPTLRNLPVAP